MPNDTEQKLITADALKGGFKADGHKARLDLIPESVLRPMIRALTETANPSKSLQALLDQSLDYWYKELDRDATEAYLWGVINSAQKVLCEDENVKPLDALLRLGELYALGASKYAARNWEKGMDFGRLWSAMMRHVLKFIFIGKYDEVDGQHHMTSVMWCAISLLYFEQNRDRYGEFDTRNVVERAQERGQQ